VIAIANAVDSSAPAAELCVERGDSLAKGRDDFRVHVSAAAADHRAARAPHHPFEAARRRTRASDAPLAALPRGHARAAATADPSDHQSSSDLERRLSG